MLADLYLCWAHYYDYCDNFEKAESVYRKGLDARAQPIELIEQAHRQFGFSMSQRILHRDESTQREFRSSMEEQRLALTSLRAHKHRHVGSIRTGPAVRSYNPGRVEQQGATSRHTNRKIQVFEDTNEAAPTSPIASTSVVQTILNSTKKQENLREPGPWSKAKIKSHALFGGVSSTKPSFSILEDDDIPPIPLPDSENNYARGIQLPNNFVRKNFPQDEFAFPLHRDDEPQKNTLYKYDKFMIFPAPDKCYSLEELRAYKWYKKHNINNDFTRTQDTVWDTGYGIPMRLPPHFVRKNAKQDDLVLDPININDALGNGQRKFGFNINQIYTANEEYSPEEILQAKWLNGELLSQKNAEMELTCGFERREEIFRRRSMAIGGRKSILPRKSDSPRKSIARKSLAAAAAAEPPPPYPTAEASQPPSTSADILSTGTIKKTSLPKRKSVYTSRTLDALSTIPETASPPILRRKLNEDEEASDDRPPPNPIKFNIFEDREATDDRNNEQVFKVPQPAPVQKSRTSSVFQDEDLDGCTTQTFNFFIKSQSISTPKVTKPHAKLDDPECMATMRKGLDFHNDSDDASASNHEMEPQTVNNAQPFTCRSVETEHQYMVEPPEIYRQKLSAIMETTEECATASSLATIASSKSSSVEEFDFTKNTNHQSSTAMSMCRQHTIINNTAKMSASMNTSTVVNRENESKKSSTLGFEIYQEDTLKANNATASQIQDNANKMVDTSKVLGLQTVEVFDKTLPPAGQFHVYEDENEEKAAGISEIQLKLMNDIRKSTNETSVIKETSGIKEKSVFEMTQCETQPSEWCSKTLINNASSLIPNKSIVKSTNSIIVPGNIQEDNSPANVPSELPKMPAKTGFQIYQEDTGLTLPAINFVEERTEQIPPIFDAIQSNVTQTGQPIYDNERTEAMTVFMPEMPEGDETKNTSAMFKTNYSRIEQGKTIDQSVAYNRSIFQVLQDDTTTNVFPSKYADYKMETMSNVPNPLQISLMDGNNSVFPMIPEMPTLPDIDFESETGYHNESQAKMMPTENDRTNASQSISNRSQMKTDLEANQSRMFINRSNVGGNTLVASNPNDFDKMPVSNQHPSNNQVNANKSIFYVQNDDDDDGKKEIHSAEKSVQNATIQKQISQIGLAHVATEKSSIASKSFTEKNKTAIDDEIYAKISPVLKTDTFNGNQSAFSKSKHTIDDEFYAMIKSPVNKTDHTLAAGMLIVDSPSPGPSMQSVRESIVVDPKFHTHQISQLREPSMSLLEPMKCEIVRESLQPDNQGVVPMGRNSSIGDTQKAFSEDCPNTAMFSLHMPFIKNSTILIRSSENIDNISDEVKTGFTADVQREY